MTRPIPQQRPRGERSAAKLRAGTRRVFRPSGPPTDEIPVWTAPDGVGVDTARAVIDLSMRAGIAMLATGAAAADVVATVLMLTKAYGLRSVHVDVTYISITVSYHRGPHADPMTVLRVVRSRTQDFTRLERLRRLVIELAARPIPVEEARVRFDAVVAAPHPYRRWVVMSGSAVLAGAVSVLIGGGWLVTTIAFLSALLIDRLQYALGKAGVAAFFSQVVAAAIPTVAATLLVLAGLKGSDVAGRASPSLVVAAGIVLLLSGLSVVGAAQDALEGFYLTAGARAFEVVVLTFGIVVGVTSVLAIGNRIGLYIAVTPSTSLDRNILIQLGCAAFISAAFAVMAYAPPRALLMSAVLGLAAWWIASTLEGSVDLGAGTSAGVAAIAVGFTARALSRRLDVPSLGVTTAAIVPLLPGRKVYQGVSEVISLGSTGLQTGLATLLGAAGIGIALAAGVSLGTYLAGVLSAWRGRRRLLPAPGATGPLPRLPEGSAD